MGSSNVIGKPEQEGDFERRCCVLFSEIVNDPDLKLVATRGKKQGGFDLVGTRNGDPDQPVGVQCKNKPSGARLDLREVEDDIRSMLASSIPVTEIYVVTTASNDLKHDELAIQIRSEQKRLGRTVNIQIWGWDTLSEKIRGSARAYKVFDPNYSPSTDTLIDVTTETLDRQSQIQAQIADGFERMQATLSAQIPLDPENTTTVDAILNQQLDDIRDLLNGGKSRSALVLLEKLQAASATRSVAIRARILANMGFAHLRMGDERKGGALMLEAHALNPGDPKMRANRVFGLFLTGDRDAAAACAIETLAADPANGMAAAYFYQIAAVADDELRPDDVVPTALWDEEGVRVTRGVYLRQRQDPRWHDWVRESARALPESMILQRFDAEATLDEIYTRRAFSAGEGDDADRARLAEATQCLQSIWDEARLQEDAAEDLTTSLAVNLITAYRALRDLDAAEVVIREAITLSPNDQGIIIAAAHVDIIRDRDAEAATKLEPLAEGPQRTIAYVGALAKLLRWEELVAFATEARRDALKGLDRQGFDVMRLHARLASNAVTDVDGAFDEVIEAWPEDLVVLATVADLAVEFHPDRFEALFSAAIARSALPAPLPERMVLVDLARRQGRYAAVIDILSGHVDTQSASDPLLALLHAYTNAGVRPDTHSFIESLPGHVLDLGHYARLAGAAEYNRGDLVAAGRHLRRALAVDPADLKSRLILAGTLQRDNREAEARRIVIESDEASLKGSDLDRLRLAGLLRREGQGSRAIALGFAAASRNRDDRQIASNYPMLIFMDQSPIPEFEVEAGAQAGYWIKLEGVGTGDIEGVLGDEAIPEALAIKSDNAVFKAVQGKAVGDEIVLPPALGIERRYVLRQIRHKWLWLADDILRTLAARFPEGAGIVQMTTQGDDIGPILDVVRRGEERNQVALATYHDSALPIAMVASLNRDNVLALSHRIVADGKPVKTCLGLHPEREAAQLISRRARGRGIVVDTLTLLTANTLEIIPPLKDYFGRIVVARSTMDELIEWRDTQALSAGQDTLSLGYEGDQAVKSSRTAEENDHQLALLRGLIECVQTHCEIAPESSEALTIDTATIDAVGLTDLLDPIRLARQYNVPLVSDDLHYRQLASLAGVEASTWLQPALLEMRSAEAIDNERYALAIVRLTALRHESVSVDSESLLALLTCAEIDDAGFDLAVGNIGGPNAELASHVRVVVAFMRNVWTLDIPSWRKGRACGKLIESLARNRTFEVGTLLDLLEVSLRRAAARSDIFNQARQYLDDWRRGHFIDSRAPAKPKRVRRRKAA